MSRHSLPTHSAPCPMPAGRELASPVALRFKRPAVQATCGIGCQARATTCCGDPSLDHFHAFALFGLYGLPLARYDMSKVVDQYYPQKARAYRNTSGHSNKKYAAGSPLSRIGGTPEHVRQTDQCIRLLVDEVGRFGDRRIPRLTDPAVDRWLVVFAWPSSLGAL